MPVFFSVASWANSRIPYTITETDQARKEMIQDSLLEINKCVGYHILVPKLTNDTDYLSIKYGRGDARVIGNVGSEQEITGNNIHTVIHEVLHKLSQRIWADLIGIRFLTLAWPRNTPA